MANKVHKPFEKEYRRLLTSVIIFVYNKRVY